MISITCSSNINICIFIIIFYNLSDNFYYLLSALVYISASPSIQIRLMIKPIDAKTKQWTNIDKLK